MEYALTFSLSFLLLSFTFFFKSTNQKPKNLPPTPPSLPIIGHLHLLKLPLHKSLNNLSTKYGTMFSLTVGCRKLVVASSPSAVEETLIRNDILFADRFPITINKHVAYNCTTLGTASYGDHWRNLRRIGSLEVFSSSRLNGFLGIRREEIRNLLEKINPISRVSSNGFGKVELRNLLLELTFNNVTRMVAGKRYYGENVSGKVQREAEQFKEMISEYFAYAGASYAGDYLPVLQWVDFTGFFRRVKRLSGKIDSFLQGLIDEHKGDVQSKNTMIGHLLSLQESEPEYYTDEIIKGFMLDIILPATESSAVTLEWAMSNLLNNADILQKAKNELNSQIGEENMMDELDLPKLPYLHNIIKETLRLHPPGPLLDPHVSSKECSVGGYHVDPNTVLLVNAWAIHRNAELWDDAIKFKPERFEGGEGGSSHEGFKLMPFGLGRRSCPGMGLAHRIVGFALGSMIHCFEWKRVSDQEIDLSERIGGLTLRKAQPLVAMCKPHDILNKSHCSEKTPITAVSSGF